MYGRKETHTRQLYGWKIICSFNRYNLNGIQRKKLMLVLSLYKCDKYNEWDKKKKSRTRKSADLLMVMMFTFVLFFAIIYLIREGGVMIYARFSLNYDYLFIQITRFSDFSSLFSSLFIIYTKIFEIFHLTKILFLSNHRRKIDHLTLKRNIIFVIE